MATSSEFPRVVLFPQSVTLTKAEWAIAYLLGRMRRATNRAAKIRDRQVGDQDPLRIDVVGAAAEIAFARVAGVFPDLDTEIRQGSHDNVLPSGRTVDVKATELPEGRLITPVSKDRLKDQSDISVLARVDLEGTRADRPEAKNEPPTITFVGYAETSELMQEHRIQKLPRETYVMEDRELHTVLGVVYASDDDGPSGSNEPENLESLHELMDRMFDDGED